jgi:hypothetical protein
MSIPRFPSPAAAGVPEAAVTVKATLRAASPALTVPAVLPAKEYCGRGTEMPLAGAWSGNIPWAGFYWTTGCICGSNASKIHFPPFHEGNSAERENRFPEGVRRSAVCHSLSCT